jgi:hypothetical protein
MVSPKLSLKMARGTIQQIRKPDSTLEQMVGMEGNSAHLVEGAEEMVGAESNLVHLVGGEEEQEMPGMEGGEGEISIKAAEEVLRLCHTNRIYSVSVHAFEYAF